MSKKEKIYIGVLVLVLIGSLVFMIFQFFNASHAISEVEAVPIIVEEPTVIPPDVQEDIQHVTQLNPEPTLMDDEIIAMVVSAEAKGEELIGMVAVASVILNRCDYWDETVESVVNETNQFAEYRTERPSEECYRAVEIARANRDLFPANMLYFRNGQYHEGEKLKDYLPIGNHYFSLLKEN